MPNLRRRSSVLTYNDDAIYRTLENQRKIARKSEPNVLKSPNVVQNGQKIAHVHEEVNKIPEFVYASDGRKFFPCLFCCHAFAVKELQVEHMKQCCFRVPTASEASEITSKIQQISKPKPPPTLVRKANTNLTQSVKISNKIYHVKLNPKLIVQKSKPKNLQLSTIIKKSAIKMVKQQPKKSAFPKIKLEPVTSTPKSTNIQSHVNKFTNNINLQPQLEGQVLNRSRNIKETIINPCPYCYLCFPSRASLVQHKREQHLYPKILVPEDQLQEFDEMYKNSDMSKCTICSKPVPKVRWSRHLQTHINERKYICSVCQKTFTRKDHLKVHEKKHVMDMVNPFIDAVTHFIDA